MYRPSCRPTLSTRHGRVGSSSPLDTWTRRHPVSGKLSGLLTVRVDGQCPKCQPRLFHRQYLRTCCISKQDLLVNNYTRQKFAWQAPCQGYVHEECANISEHKAISDWNWFVVLWTWWNVEWIMCVQKNSCETWLMFIYSDINCHSVWRRKLSGRLNGRRTYLQVRVTVHH